MILEKFNIKQVAQDKAWYIVMTGNFQALVIQGRDYNFDPIETINSIDEISLNITTESGKEYNLLFKDYQLIDMPVIRVLRNIRGYHESIKALPILQAIYDMTTIVYQEITIFSAEDLKPEKIADDYYDVCEIKDKDLLISAATYLLKGQKE